MTTSVADLDQLKRRAAIRAVEEVADGMVVGLGSGSTAAFAVEALAKRVAAGLRVSCIPTSEQTATLARQMALPLSDFAAHRVIDLTIDGADQVERGTLNLIKGRGGALLREKIVAAASHRLVIIVDDTKLVDALGGTMPLPVEVVPFGYETLLPRLETIGLTPALRQREGLPFVTDGGHYILDCRCGRIEEPAVLERRLAQMTGVVESGLFIEMAESVMIGRVRGVEVLSVTS